MENRKLGNILDHVSIICFVNIICFCAFYLTSVYLTEFAIFGVPALGTPTTFIVGFFVRPLGALWFGIRGDNLGYVRAMKESILLLVICTALIGLLPVAEMFYLFAVLRTLQGVGIGGCYAAMAVYIYQASPVDKKGQITSILQTSVPIGYLSGLLIVIMLKIVIPSDSFQEWGWRVAFFLPLTATLLFQKMLSSLNNPIHSRSLTPGMYLRWIKICVKHLSGRSGNWLPPSILAFGIGAMMFTTSASYRFYFMKALLKMDPVLVDLSSAIATLLFLPFYYMGGRLSDKYGSYFISLLSVLFGAMLFIPVFKYLEFISLNDNTYKTLTPELYKTILAITALSSIVALSYGSFVSLICKNLPRKIRCTLFALIYSVTVGVTGGFIQMIGLQAYIRHDEKYAGPYLATFIALFSVILSSGVFFYNRKRETRLK